MAIYYFNCQIISRGEGRSAVAAAAYRAAERITNQYDGVTHDFNHKGKVAFSNIMLPDNAPEEFQNRAVLWNAVEDAEKSINAQLAREIVVALPVELTLEQQIGLIEDYVRKSFVDKGMCADVAIHTPEHTSTSTGELVSNPHAHIMLTMRPLDENGKWEPKAQKAYICYRAGAEKPIMAAEFKAAHEDGWEKQYQYKQGNQKLWLTQQQGKELGLERIDKSPKSEKIPNPTAAEWNSKGAMLQWRESWADAVNAALEAAGVYAHVDHRSYEEQGKLQVGMIHEGTTATALKRKGIQTDRGNLNREIREGNQRIKQNLNAAAQTEETLSRLLNGEAPSLLLKSDMKKQKDDLERSPKYCF